MNDFDRKLGQLRAHANDWASSSGEDQAERERLGKLATKLRDLIADIEGVMASIKSPQRLRT
jgi:hypothetical protein